MSEAPSRLARAGDWCFRSRQTGRITIGQWPNLPLVLFGILAMADRLFRPEGGAGTALRTGAALALAWWAADELVRGVNPWRRALGGTVLAAQAILLLLAVRAG